MPAEYKPCEIEIDVGDGVHLFRLKTRQIAELQTKCDAGIGAIYARVLQHMYREEDLNEVIRLGLIGGGMTGLEARDFMVNYVIDIMPLEHRLTTAVNVLGACVHGYEPEGDVPKKTQAAGTDGSTSRQQSETEPSSDSHPKKSEN